MQILYTIKQRIDAFIRKTFGRCLRKVYCPFCFEAIWSTEIQFKCKNKQCSRYNNTIPREPSFWEKWDIVRSPNSTKCDQCGEISTYKVCPHPNCRMDLPFELTELSDITIAIIGARGSGKTHYIALLVRRIQQLVDDFDWYLTPLDHGTVERYTNEFEDPLFKGHITIPATQAGRGRPLLYSLQLKKLKKNIMLAFFDTAGENFNPQTTPPEEMDFNNRYICNASGIICLLDPLQMTPVRRELQKSITLPPQSTDTAQVINGVYQLIKRGFETQKRKMTWKNEVPIPLAVVFSKIDAISAPDQRCPPTLLEQSNAVYKESRHRGYLNLGDFNNINGYMRDWLSVVDESMSIRGPCGHFDSVAYFGVSALGQNPQKTGNRETLAYDPRPQRVEDPFLWILHKKGLISARRD